MKQPRLLPFPANRSGRVAGSPAISRRGAIARIAGAAALLTAARTGNAQASFPMRPLRIVVPYAAGGTTDLLAREVGQQLTEHWGQPVVVENRPGGGTVIGATTVAKAPADGYTLLLANNTHVISPHLMANLPYDALRDFSAVATMATSAYLLLARPSLAANSFAEFLALARQQPGRLNFGTHGVGGLTHLGAELLNAQAGIKLEMVQYKGAAPALNGILGGEVDVYLDAPATTVPYVRSGKLKALGITGSRRLASLPEVPTLAEAGLPGYDVTIWYALIGPAGIPRELVSRINRDVGQVLVRPDVQEKLSSLGVEPFISSPEAFAGWMKTEHEKYRQVVATANIPKS